MAKKYIIFGTGAFLSDIFDLVHAADGRVHQIYRNVVDKPDQRSVPFEKRVGLLGYGVEVFDSLSPFRPEEGCEYVIGVPTVQKYVLVEELKNKFGLTFKPLIHPTVHLGSNVHLGEGVIVNAGSVLGPNVYLEDFCAVNRAVMLGHDTRVGKYSRIGPAAAIAGNVRIGAKCSIGINATILEDLLIGDWAVVGAASLVTKDVPPGVVAFGVPARVVKENENQDFEKYMANRDFMKR